MKWHNLLLFGFLSTTLPCLYGMDQSSFSSQPEQADDLGASFMVDISPEKPNFQYMPLDDKLKQIIVTANNFNRYSSEKSLDPDEKQKALSTLDAILRSDAPGIMPIIGNEMFNKIVA